MAVPEATLVDAVKRFVAEARAEPLERISETTRLREDLSLSGDDVEEFFAEFSKRFQVDLEGFDFHRHFREEPHLAWPLTELWHAWQRGSWATETITVRRLIAVARGGKWTAAKGKL